jgi:uncharacterized membrane protein YesL
VRILSSKLIISAIIGVVVFVIFIAVMPGLSLFIGFAAFALTLAVTTQKPRARSNKRDRL